jgi:hypothetical protein
MTITEAIKTLNYYGKEKAQADKSNMDWRPDARTGEEVSEAYDVVLASKNAENRLTKAGATVYEREGEKRM